MKYKNIIFDFGNVVGTFDGRYMLRQFFPDAIDQTSPVFRTIFRNWGDLDAGVLDYWEYARESAEMLPDESPETIDAFFRKWPEYVTIIEGTRLLIEELKRQGASVYLLSNAPTYFAEWALEHFDILKGFSGIVFSAPLKMAKPEPEIYRYLFETFRLDPSECFFIDDLERNIEAGRKLGMDGIVFTGDMDKVKEAIGL